MGKEEAVYSHGHHKSVVTSHARRTAQDSAGFLIPHLKTTDIILDIGCGPGSITCDLAKLVPQGKITGVDAAESVLEQARELASSRGLQNITFEAVDANSLPYPDASFNIVFCHQVLQHVKNPIGVLKEMRRVTKPGGIVAAREADYKSFAWYPESKVLDKWGDVYQQVAFANGGEPNAGRMIHAWAQRAGFEPNDIEISWNSWCYTKEKAKLWGLSWADRTTQSAFATTAKANNLATDEDLQAIRQAWTEWAEDENALIAVPSGEILCRVS